MVEAERKIEKVADACEDKVRKKENALPEKVFIVRESLITELFKDKNIRAIYNFFLAVLFGLVISNVLNDYFGINTEKSSIALVLRSFGKPRLVIITWLATFLSTLLAFRCFNLWAMIRCNVTPKKIAIKILDHFFIALVISYYLATYYVLTKAVFQFDLPSASTAFVLLEGTRMLMKVHAFIRSSAPEVLSYKPHSERRIVQKSLSKFVYFMFAPTLIYRDEYPRTKEIRWSYVAKCVLEVFGEILFCSAICQHILIPNFEDFGRRKYTWTEVALKSFSSVPAGMLTSLLLFYCVLHSWQNAFAELLRFGDRLFYKDWWTCTSYSRFYRTWNVVVHDWLYAYIYKDVHDWLIPGRKNVARFLVVLVSGLVHEYLMSVILRSFCPILFVQFVGLGTLFASIKFPESSVWNMLFLYSYAFGCGIQLTFYSLEKRARINNPQEISSILDFFDWWTSTDYSRYYRTWNQVVHEWLRSYIYEDFLKYIFPNKLAAKLLVVFISAVVHEYVLTLSLRCFIPVLFLMFFVLGTLLTYIRVPQSYFWNMLFLYSFALGFGIQLYLYTIEWHARFNSPLDETKGVLEFFKPRAFTCDCFE